jgi:pyruvate dehydrogenase E2 component (dihydrolipoamide acetyltransferase)
MPINILMPALSPTMEEGNLAKWLVKEGDRFRSGDVIAEIETDKATMEVEAVDEGTVGKIVVPEGTDGVKVNTVIAVLLEDGESADDAPGGGSAARAQGRSADQGSPSRTPRRSTRPRLTHARSGTARRRRADSRIFASPLARRIAKQNGIDISQPCPAPVRMAASSRQMSRRKRKGVHQARRCHAPAPQASHCRARCIAQGPSDDMVLKLFAEGSYEELPHDGMRKTIASRLSESKQTVPHFYVISVDCQLDALLKLRGELNKAAPEKGRQACLQAVGQRHGHQGAGAGPARRAGCQCLLDRRAHGAAQAFRCRRGCGHSRRPDHADRPPAEEKALSAISNEMKDIGKRAQGQAS